jgi:hypothetical protein
MTAIGIFSRLVLQPTSRYVPETLAAQIASIPGVKWVLINLSVRLRPVIRLPPPLLAQAETRLSGACVTVLSLPTCVCVCVCVCGPPPSRTKLPRCASVSSAVWPGLVVVSWFSSSTRVSPQMEWASNDSLRQCLRQRLRQRQCLPAQLECTYVTRSRPSDMHIRHSFPPNWNAHQQTCAKPVDIRVCTCVC